jgi:hypothetical protein
MLDGSKSELVKAVKELMSSLEDDLNPKRLKDEGGKLVFSDDIPLHKALHLRRVLDNRIYGRGLPPFTELYVARFLPGGQEVPKSAIKSAMNDAFKEPYFQALHYVARHLGDEPRTLVQVTSNAYNAKRAGHTSYRGRIRDNLIPKLGKVGLWKSTEVGNGWWNIEAGPTLDAFIEHIYVPWALRQAKFYGEFLKKRGEE